jgi:membrane-associated phospholipid phosphatase
MRLDWSPQEILRQRIIAGVMVADCCLLAIVRLRFDYASLVTPVLATLVFAVLGQWYRQRREEGIAATLIGTSHLVAFGASSLILNYLLMPYDRPSIDPFLNGLDRSIGLDWLAAYAAFKSNAMLSELLSMAYLSTLPLVALMIPLLGLTRRGRDLDLFLLALFLATLAAVGFWAYFPSNGSGTYLFATGQFDAPPGAVSDKRHIETVLALEAGRILEFSLNKSEGLIGFPSMHTVMAVLIVHAVRGLPRIFWPVLVWNGLVIVSVPFDGGHNFCDVAGGLGLTWLSVAAAQRVLAAPADQPDAAAVPHSVAGDPVWIRPREA